MTTSLKSLMLPEKTMEFEFPGCDGLKFDIAYLGRDRLQKLTKDATEMVPDKSMGFTPKEKFNEEKFMHTYVASVVKGWKGFKFKYLPEFLLVDISSEDPEALFPYTEENSHLLITNSNVLDSWVSKIISDLSNFTKPDSEMSTTKSENT